MSRSLDIEQRVAARRAIEEVYWRHRIWPAENKSPKPPLAATWPEPALRSLVEDELRMSNALATWWGSRVSARELQAEIDRMARDTRDPALLRELLAALGRDPLLVAETLARPMFVDRSIRSRYAFDDRFHGDVRRRAEQALQSVKEVADLRAAGGQYVEQTFRRSSPGRHEDIVLDSRRVIELENREWEAWRQDLAARFLTAVESIPVLQISTLKEETERFSVTVVLSEGAGETRVALAIWPKRSFDEWWREVRASTSPALDEHGGAYTLTEPASEACPDDSWETRFFAPAATSGHTAVWTGTEMIVWGGYTGFTPTAMGGRYNPAIDSWRPTSTGLNVPAGRRLHSAVWTGSEMIVWGGESIYGPMDPTANVGGRYNPLTDSWVTTSTAGQVPVARRLHTAVWTGSEMIVWGGGVGTTVMGSGGRYDPATDSWAAIPEEPPAPSPRALHTAVWTGTEMIVWGGASGFASSSPILNTGGSYNPGSNTWTPTPISMTGPEPRKGHTAVWTGTEMIAWGGIGSSDPFYLRGLRYSPATNSWTKTAALAGSPSQELGHAAVWTGSEMIVWGGRGSVASRGARYAPTTDSWSTVSLVPDSPGGREGFSAVWTGTEMIVWGGLYLVPNDSYYTSTGDRYDPATDGWRPVSVGSEVPAVRFLTSAVWTGVEMIVWGGFNGMTLNSGGLYRPATDTWQATATGAGVPWGRANHSAVWTGTEMIVWGGGDPPISGDNTGGRYSPATNTWTPTSTAAGVPQGRESHSALWTGQEMVIWGGFATLPTDQTFNSGGRYNPSTDSWVPTSLGENAPAARSGHSAVWTGSEMIVWGGSQPGVGRVNTGGRYDPSLDSWLPTPVGEGVPSPRFGHAATWTGSEMLVLGGSSSDASIFAGDRYDPVADSWVATSPTELTRNFGEAAWTGSEMIIWAGGAEGKPGARYHPGTDGWSAMSTGRNMPPSHSGYQSVWTGSLMLMWGGVPLSPTLGVYCARDCHAPGDEDGDTVGDACDRCPAVPDPGQGDFDDDGLGDACESGAPLADIDGSARVDGFDLARLARAFGRCDPTGGYDTAVDLDRNGCVDGTDLAFFADYFGDAIQPVE